MNDGHPGNTVLNGLPALMNSMMPVNNNGMNGGMAMSPAPPPPSPHVHLLPHGAAVNEMQVGAPLQLVPEQVRLHSAASSSSPSAVCRRPAPSFMGMPPDFRINELNKRLQLRTEESDNLWWDGFATEFFEDDATLTLTFCLEDGPKRYTIGRTLIPRYFRSIFEGGVTDLHYVLHRSQETFNNNNTLVNLECEQASMVTQHGKPMFPYVVTEGRLSLEFTFDDMMRIRTWHFAIRQHREFLPRSVVGMQAIDPSVMEQMSKNITRQGLTNYTLNFLRLCVILEPMQELMSRHKAYGLNPRDCLKTTLFQKWQRMVAPVGKETTRPANKRRKRKGSAGNNSGVGNNNSRDVPPSGKQKRSPGPHGFNIGASVPGDVMVVGEPTLMGGEFGDEDERLITRLENHQFDGTGGSGPGEGEGTDQKFNTTSPAWAQGDKKTPPSSGPGGGPPPPSLNPEPEIKTE
ncbi:LIM domain-binding protein 2-like isoform X2 [Babylonia areolata]|uniref:LIM domain-binding protein 2-like isoform X2 n=1 Tax=Babylonia areolata TaxID=304850 RepID=UPI003FD2D312